MGNKKVFKKKIEKLLSLGATLSSKAQAYLEKEFKPSPNHSPKGCGKIFEYKRKGLHITGACGDIGYTDGFVPLCEEEKMNSSDNKECVNCGMVEGKHPSKFGLCRFFTTKEVQK